MFANSQPTISSHFLHGRIVRVLSGLLSLPASFRSKFGDRLWPSPMLDQQCREARYTFDDAVRVFETDFLPTIKPKAATRYRVSIKALMRSFSGVPIAGIATSNLMQFIAVRRTEGVQGSTIKRDLACLSLILQLATSKGWVLANPVRTLDLGGLEDGHSRTRYLARE